MLFPLVLCTLISSTAAGRADLPSKRGLALLGDAPSSDNELLTSEESPISWYYTWSPWPSDTVAEDVVFLPLLHGIDTVEDPNLHDILGNLPSSSTHILTFNEPDGEQDTGGSSISPEDAAEAYLKHVVPLREPRDGDTRTWNISHPVVTGSDMGIEWLRNFNKSCYELSDDGCPADFVAVHWYGPFAGLTWWLDTLKDFYGSNETDMTMWITEMALPQEDSEANEAMMTESIEYLESQDYVEGYAWFGAFRTDNSNGWTGDGVSLFDDDGGLTDLGATYLGGEENGFEPGMSGAGITRGGLWAVAMAVACCLLCM
ncbi:glycosyl hydrolase catalytic core-domain-containing protein [Plectosphaerella plurivora]|uniref:Glycosyl hydrolase catalytic core-domain-containing protein n=1 Tax=Plectosphaerella plurivora TaxID=936078 RepID=A0A9P9AAD0_9PEZI|nr:glycosyl hydrolase catalytic core-domain-containing protein [Plectosphaerella plurivora]